MSKGLTTRDLSRLLGVSTSTLRIWEDVLQLPIPRDEQNHRRYPPECVETLTAIARMRQSGQDYATIARELRLNYQSAGPVDDIFEEPDPPAPAPAPQQAVVTSHEPVREAVTPTLIAKDQQDLLAAYTRLSEDHRTLSAKYAEATFAIGQLEERVHHLTQQLVDAESRAAKLELHPPKPLALPEPPPAADDGAIRDLESQVKLLAMAMLSQRPMSLWERMSLWWSR